MRFGKSPIEKSMDSSRFYRDAYIHDLPSEPCLIDVKLTDGSSLKSCRVETAFTTRLEVDIYYKTALIDPAEILQWRYS